MGKGLIALSSAAIASVYGIGYIATQPAAASMDYSPVPASASPEQVPTMQAPSSTAASPATKPSPTATVASNGLKDGTYSGTGTSRHGSVSVSLTVQNGRIASAPITRVTTRYSQNVIAGLPAAVVSAQTPRVNMISGATDSSMAYESAVAQALAQAGGSTAAAPASGSQGSGSGGSVQVTGPNGTIYSNPPQDGGGRRRRGFAGSTGD